MDNFAMQHMIVITLLVILNWRIIRRMTQLENRLEECLNSGGKVSTPPPDDVPPPPQIGVVA